MILLAPLLAGLAVLAAVPVLIHLLLKRRPRVIPFAAIEFVLASLRRVNRRLQLRELIILALRTLVVLLLAMAMARPTLTSRAQSALGHGETVAVIVLDRSMSMQYRQGAASRFEQAQQAVHEVIEALPRQARAALVLVDSTGVAEIPEPTRDLAMVTAAAEQARAGAGGTDLLAGLEAAWRILERTPAAGREIYVISDFQANGMPGEDDPRMASLIAKLNASTPVCHLVLMDVAGGDHDVANLSVSSVNLPDRLATVDVPVTIEATVRHHGAGASEGVRVECFVAAPGDSALRKIGERVLERVDSVEMVRFETRFASSGLHRVEVRIGDDPLATDNRGHLVVDVLDQLRVLLVDGRRGGRGAASATFFLRWALAPIDPLGRTRPPARCEVIGPEEMLNRPLLDYHAVVLADVPTVSRQEAATLRAYVEAGGGVVVFLGPQVVAGEYNEVMWDATHLLPARLGEAITVDGEGTGLATTDLRHPILEAFQPRQEREFIEAPRFRRFFALELGDDPTPTARVVARYVSGQPAIVERSLGLGRIVLFSSSADRSWSDFPLRGGAYLPLVLRTVQHVAMGERPARTVHAHEPLVALVPTGEGGEILLATPQGRVRRLTVETAAGGGRMARYDQTEQSGFYGIGWAGAADELWYAVNPPPTASDLTALREGEIRRMYPGLQFDWIGPDADVLRAVSRSRVGTELWPLLGFLAAICLVSEWLLLARWAPREGAR